MKSPAGALQTLSVARLTPAPANPVNDSCSALSATLWVGLHGQIQDCDETALEILGYTRAELKGRHLSLVLPELSCTELLDDECLNARLAFRCRCGIPFRALSQDGVDHLYCVHFNVVSTSAGAALSVILAEPVH